MKRLPFDTKNLCGYLMGMALQSIIIRCACIFSANFLSLGIGCFIFVISSIRDMKGTLRSINKNAKSNEIVANRSRSLKRLSEFIQLHSKTKQLSLKSFIRKRSEQSFNFHPSLFFQSNIGIYRILPTISRYYSYVEPRNHWYCNGIGRNAISSVTN